MSVSLSVEFSFFHYFGVVVVIHIDSYLVCLLFVGSNDYISYFSWYFRAVAFTENTMTENGNVKRMNQRTCKRKEAKRKKKYWKLKNDRALALQKVLVARRIWLTRNDCVSTSVAYQSIKRKWINFNQRKTQFVTQDILYTYNMKSVLVIIISPESCMHAGWELCLGVLYFMAIHIFLLLISFCLHSAFRFHAFCRRMHNTHYTNLFCFSQEENVERKDALK